MKFKGVLSAFIFVIFASLVMVVIYLQSESFGKLLTRVGTDILYKKYEIKLETTNLEINLFPPGIHLKNVSLSMSSDEIESLEIEFGTIGYNFGLFELEEKNFSIGEIYLGDGFVNLKTKPSNTPVDELDKQLIKKIFKYQDFIPLRIDSVLVENSIFFTNEQSFDAKKIKIFKESDDFIVRLHLHHVKMTPQDKFELDEIWADSRVSVNELEIQRLKLKDDVHNLLLSGVVKDYFKLKKSMINLNGMADLDLEAIFREYPFPVLIKNLQGQLNLNFDISIEQENLKGELGFNLESLNSNVLKADKVTGNIKIKEDQIYLGQLKLNNGLEKFELKKSAVISDLKFKKILSEPLYFSLSQFQLTNALGVLGDDLKVLKGELTGDVAFEFKDKNIYFFPEDNFLVKSLRLVTGENNDEFKIIYINNVHLTNGAFAVIGNQFRMESQVKLANSNFNLKGEVDSSNVSFEVKKGDIDLADLGGIANLDILGKGTLDVKVFGPTQNVSIDIKGKTKGFGILGYFLDESDKHVTISLGDSSVIINKFDSVIGKTQIIGNGSVNYKNADIAIGITANNSNFTDLSRIIKPILNELQFLPDDLSFGAKVDVDIFGKYNLDKLKLRTTIHLKDIFSFGEEFDNGRFDLNLNKKIIEIKNIELSKSQGRLYGSYGLDLKNKNMEIDFNWDNFQLNNFNFGKKYLPNFSSFFSGRVNGGGRLSDYKLKIVSTAFNTKSAGNKFENSNFDLVLTNHQIGGKINLLGTFIRSDFNLSLDGNSNSEISAQIKSSSIKPLFVAFLGQHIQTENLSGSLDFELNSSFYKGFQQLSLRAQMKELNLNHPEFNFNYQSTSPEFIIQNGKVEKWNFNSQDPDLKISTQGQGNLASSATLVNEFQLNSKLLEILLASVLSSEGFITNTLKINFLRNDFNYNFMSKTNNLDISINQLPIQLNKINYNLAIEDKKLIINQFKASLSSGAFQVKGDVFFGSTPSDVNIKFNLDKAEIPIFGQSSINVSADGMLVGNKYPYSLGGEVTIHRAQIINELNEFSTKSSGFSQVRFLPQNQESMLSKFVSLNIGAKLDRPARITNSLMDVALDGEVRLTGNPMRPVAEGRLSSPPNSSRIFFKNNEYQITRADINFNSKKAISNPDFDVQAQTIISTYKIFPKAYGDLERFSFDLTSDPSLPRNSILSLIAFGYTDEMQGSLYTRDQQSLTQVGVGSFVFDRFKISDILNKQFGLQVNLGTVIEQSTTDSLLSGRTQDVSVGQGAGGLGRTRSATKIELKKRLDEATTLSVSSTMGGSIGQRQSMNLNYGLSKSVQLEGVYELRTNEEGEADIIYNSIGGDIKFRRTFK